MMNSIALSVIIEVDELLFRGLVPDAVAQLVFKTRPMELPFENTKMSRTESLIRLAGTALFVVLFGLMYLTTMHSSMTDILSETCHGATNFIMRQDLSRNFVVVAGAYNQTDSGYWIQE